jgi:hypothetical protein
MNKYPIIGGSISAVVLLVLASLTNVVGFQTVQSSDQKIILGGVNQKELLFQTILDMANNKEIQKVILASEITGKGFFTLDMRFSVFTPSVLTEKFLKRMYAMDVLLSKTISKTKIHSMIERYQVSNLEVQKEINAVIEKDAPLKSEMVQLSNMKCDCENENTTVWHFPIICMLLYPLFVIITIIFKNAGWYPPWFIEIPHEIILSLGQLFHCSWYPY